jgi:hypothetical protein
MKLIIGTSRSNCISCSPGDGIRMVVPQLNDMREVSWLLLLSVIGPQMNPFFFSRNSDSCLLQSVVASRSTFSTLDHIYLGNAPK